MKNLVIIGAGGHGLVVAETAELMQCWGNIYFIDEKFPEPTMINEFPVLDAQSFAHMQPVDTDIAVALGDNIRRLQLINSYTAEGYACPSIIHPQASVSRSASVGAGTVIFAKAVVNAKAIIGVGCIINTAAIIEHQCVLGGGVHISPNACLAGNVTVGAKSWIGAGAVIINNKHIGHNVTVGAGAVVVSDIPGDQCVVGVPARPISTLIKNIQDKT